MKIVKYIGGLGNQLFTYAFSLALQKRYNERIYSDLLYYGKHEFHNGFELQNVFDIKLYPVSVRDVWKLTWYIPNYYLDYHLHRFLPAGLHSYKESKDGAYNEKVFSYGNKSIFYFGFWQDYRYFHNFRNEIINSLKFKNPLNQKNTEIAKVISESEESVGIHIRRGDYINHPMYRGICTIDYYKYAILNITSKFDNPKFFIFSNDIDWCIKNIVPLLGSYHYTLIDWNKGKQSFVDMQLMTLCKALIIANSTFSWWGAYLNKRNPYVIAPRKWINNDWTFKFTPDKWVTI